MAKVIPIFKSGSMAEIDNYRPISILPTLSKILERMGHKQLMKHLEFNAFLSEHQFGFRANRSTELAATFFIDLIRKKADGGKHGTKNWIYSKFDPDQSRSQIWS